MTRDATRRAIAELQPLVDAGLSVPLTSDGLRLLAEAARETSDYFDTVVAGMFTPERAAMIRRWRVDDGYTWREVGARAREVFQGEWSPPSNQLMGCAWCDAAARHFGEDYMEPPWN